MFAGIGLVSAAVHYEPAFAVCVWPRLRGDEPAVTIARAAPQRLLFAVLRPSDVKRTRR
jgi:hypothetical protein